MRQFELTTPEKTTLNGFFLLQNLPPTLVAQTLADSRCREAAYARGQVIYDPTHFDRALGFILSGKVEASQHRADQSLPLRLLESGDVFGAAALFAHESDYPTRLTALTKTRVLFFEEALLRELMAKSPQAAENYIAFLSGRVHFLNHRIHSLIAGSAEALLVNFLVSHIPNGKTITLDTSVSALARRLGISRASLYRAFDTLERRALIAKSGKTITILNWDRLQTL